VAGRVANPDAVDRGLDWQRHAGELGDPRVSSSAINRATRLYSPRAINAIGFSPPSRMTGRFSQTGNRDCLGIDDLAKVSGEPCAKARRGQAQGPSAGELAHARNLLNGACGAFQRD
jgi:hypothetical protein